MRRCHIQDPKACLRNQTPPNSSRYIHSQRQEIMTADQIPRAPLLFREVLFIFNILVIRQLHQSVFIELV